MSTAALLLDGLAAIVFGASGLSKAMEFTNFQLEIASYRLLPVSWIGLAAWMVVLTECGLFLAFCLGPSGELLRGIVVLVFLFVLTILSGLKGWRRSQGLRSGCACFGRNHPLGFSPMTRNLVLLILFTLRLSLSRESGSLIGNAGFACSVLTVVFVLEIVKLFREGGRGSYASD